MSDDKKQPSSADLTSEALAKEVASEGKQNNEEEIVEETKDAENECANCVDLGNKYKRALADYQNLFKETAREKEGFAKFANERIILDMIAVYDNLKISLAHAGETEKSNGWAEGIKYIIKQFGDVLKNYGVEEIKTEGEKFDPNTMEAVEGSGDVVKREIRAGYKLSGKVIVAAKVALN
jgi:molecular chaperone GrpE